jgi:hypothetical protein
MSGQQTKENNDRLVERIRRGDRGFKRIVIERALRSPHPVDDTSAARIDTLSISHDAARIRT